MAPSVRRLSEMTVFTRMALRPHVIVLAALATDDTAVGEMRILVSQAQGDLESFRKKGTSSYQVLETRRRGRCAVSLFVLGQKH